MKKMVSLLWLMVEKKDKYLDFIPGVLLLVGGLLVIVLAV